MSSTFYYNGVPPAATGSTAAPEPRPEHEASFSGSGSAEKLV
jgi:hypothetical protein